MFNTPILFLVFNRPDTTKQVFAKIKEVKPKQLFIASDGARIGKEGEQEKVEAVRNYILKNIDWQCEIKTLFRERNLGCGRAVSEAITWFFENVEQGIILEDDTLPNTSFFHFCETLLNYYQNNKKIFMISGDNFQNGIKRGEADYYFSVYTHIWGWATWKRSWQKYDFQMKKLQEFIHQNKIKKYFKNKQYQEFWLNNFIATQKGEIDTWDYQLMFACLYNEGLVILPNANLVTNIGFREDATHTKSSSTLANIPTEELEFPLKHNTKVFRCKKADEFTRKNLFSGKSEHNMLKNIIKLPIKILYKLKHKYRLIRYPQYRKNYEKQQVLSRISQVPRFIEGETNILGKKVKFVDSASFCFIYDELFNKEIYKFETTNPTPYIIDAGANIGLSVVYFKKLFPNAEIIAFEPDSKVFKALEYNVQSFGFKNVQLIQKALWNEETTLKFYSEGADGGRIATHNDTQRIVEIQTCRLLNYLNKKVELLKIDIEGAEIVVLEDCKGLLHNVERIFVEYHSFTNKEQKLYQLLKILEKAGFRYQVQHIGVFSHHPFVKITEYNNMDLQLNIFAYRV